MKLAAFVSIASIVWVVGQSKVRIQHLFLKKCEKIKMIQHLSYIIAPIFLINGDFLNLDVISEVCSSESSS